MSRHSRGKKTRISRPSFADRQGNWCLSNHFPYPGGPAACARLARLARIPRCPHCRRRGGVTTVAGLRTIWWNQATPNSSPGGAAELSPPLQRWESARTTQVPEGRPSSGPVPRVRVRSLNANLGGRNFARAFSKSGIPHCKNHAVPPSFFHHIFLVRSSQTCTTIAAKIPRQCTIEKCASLQRRTPFRPQTFTCSLTTNGPGQHPRKCTPNRTNQR